MAETKKKTLAVAIAVFNEEKNVETCLNSVKSLTNELVVVDGGSTDNTVAVVKKFNAYVIQSDNPPIFHINKQKAMEACNSEWILQMDADEEVTQALGQEILGVISGDSAGYNAYYIPRRNYFWGHFMKKGGQYPDYVIRLVRNGKGKFPSKSVHEQIEVEGSVGYLKEPMLHYSYKNRSDYWRKADKYTSLTAQELADKHMPKSIRSWFQYVILKPTWTFLSIFIRHKGFIDGLTGFEFALYSGIHYAIAYRKFSKL